MFIDINVITPSKPLRLELIIPRAQCIATRTNIIRLLAEFGEKRQYTIDWDAAQIDGRAREMRPCGVRALR